jgi:hypothetical protein
MSNRMRSWLPWALVLGTGVWAARRPEAVRGRLHDIADRVADAVETLEPFASRVRDDVIPSVASAASSTTHAVEPWLSAAGEAASSWLERGGRVVGEASRWGGETAHEVTERTARSAKGLGAKVGAGLAALGAWRQHERGKVSNMDSKWQMKLEKQLMARMAKHEQMIDELGHGMDRIVTRMKYMDRPRRGGISLGTILLGAGAYYLYRNPDLVYKALEAVGIDRARVERHLEKAGEAVKDGVERVQQGDDPVDAAKDAAKTVGAEAGKAGKAAKSEAERIAKDMAADAKEAARDVGNAGKDAARDAKMSA